MIQLCGSAAELWQQLVSRCPENPPMPAVKRQLLDYQMLALYWLARDYNHIGARILEIGTGYGGSGYMLAHAAPLARILSLTVDKRGAGVARYLWESAGLRNVRGELVASWDYLAETEGTAERWDMIFIDGDHNRIARDLPWFNRIAPEGLLLCHDYSPQDCPRASAIVYGALNEMARRLGRPFDVQIVDDEKTGMAGFYRRAGERWA